jgi:hypothetical protein
MNLDIKIPFEPNQNLELIYKDIKEKYPDIKTWDYSFEAKEGLGIHILEILGSLTQAYRFYDNNLQFGVIANSDDFLPQMTDNILGLNNILGKSLKDIISILIHANIDSDDIMRYYEKLLNERNLQEAYFFEKNILKTVFCYARHCNIYDSEFFISRSNFKIPIKPDTTYNRAGRVLGIDIQIIISNSIGQITNELFRTRELGDFNSFQHGLMGIFLRIMALYDLLGLEEESLLEIYYRHESK